MKTLTLNLDDQLYDEITRNVGDMQPSQYIKQILQGYINNLKNLNKNSSVAEETENFGSLYAVLKDIPKANYNGSPLAIQQQMRDEWR